jgi:hypothetical protein
LNTSNALSKFDPRKVALYEKENWVAYYQKRWLRLLQVSVGMVKEAFHLSLWQAVYGAYLVGRAEIAAAPFPDNDIPLAEKYTQRFYRFIKKIHHLNLEVERAAHLEVNWWVVHRKLFGQTQNQELVDALVDLYCSVYGLNPHEAHPAAFHRAQAMLFSDRWVNEGRVGRSPLLANEEDELLKSYSELREALISRLEATDEQGFAAK